MGKTSVGLSEETKKRLDSYKAWLAYKKRPEKITLDDAINHLIDVAEKAEGK